MGLCYRSCLCPISTNWPWRHEIQ